MREQLKPLVALVRSAWGTNGVAAHLDLMDAKLENLAREMTGLATRPPPAGPALQPTPEPPVLPVVAAAPAPPPLDISLMLHQSRSVLLRDMPPGARRLLSAGCAGTWYFDWVEHCYGRVAEHIGIEFYSERPHDLPANVTWIANTASNMEAVPDASCDLVFSGQNLEHLWGHEVAGFLVEAARVIRTGGHLVVDSPNRELTSPLNWSHPEHTIELTVPEIHRLLELAGFDVTKETGLWLCRDPKSRRVLPVDPNAQDPDWSFVERLVAAQAHPHDAFLWWLEGRRNGRPPDRAGIDALLAEAYREAWPERIQRLVVPAGRRLESRADGDWVVMPPGEGGVAMFGPNMPLRAGRHRVSFDIAPDPASSGVLGFVDLCVGPEPTILQRRDITAGDRRITLEIELPSLAFGGQFRCFSSAGGFAIRRHVTLEESLA